MESLDTQWIALLPPSREVCGQSPYSASVVQLLLVGNQNSTAKDIRFQRGGRDAVEKKKKDQGDHECEVFGGGFEVAESAYAWDTCSKNPGHAHFIPVTEFCIDHLPKWCADLSVVECVRTIAALTVRLRVAYTSWDRPDGYSFSNHRGSDVLHTGSGWVRGVYPGTGTCQCSECRRSSCPSETWFEVQLETACHVVYNTEEAQMTMVDFFYDDDRAQVEGWAKTVHAIKTEDKDKKADSCKLFCAVHDQDVAQMLLEYLSKTNYMNSYIICAVYSRPRDRQLCIVVSHPHGQPKQVTVGEEPVHLTAEDDYMYYTYSTDTCPGSSGAPVVVVELLSRPAHKKNIYKNHASFLPPHSQWLRDQGLNQSSAASFRRNRDNTSYPLRVVLNAPRRYM